MVLPSQHGRANANRQYMYRRKRLIKRGPLVVLGIAVVVAGLITWRLVGGGPDDASAADDQVAPNDAEPTDRAEAALQRAANRRTGFDRDDAKKDAGPSAANSANNRTKPQAKDDRPTVVLEPATKQNSPQTPESKTQTKSASGASSANAALATPEPRTTPAPNQSPRLFAGNAAPSTSEADDNLPRIERPSAEAVRRARQRMMTGFELLNANRNHDARLVLTAALTSRALEPAENARIRQTLEQLNRRMVFSPEVFDDDPYALRYTIQSGDTLDKITKNNDLHVEWRFIQQINEISDPRRIRLGQTIKLITGPFHAVVDKRDYRLDLFMGEGSQQVYVCSFNVGLGEHNTTPVGVFAVRPQSKLINPKWVNPRTGEVFEPDDPANPIGEYWIGLDGVSESVRDVTGYGIHGTIEPDSIGTDASMGCIRLLPDDIRTIWGVLTDASTIEVLPR